jgi:hypothetical protein
MATKRKKPTKAEKADGDKYLRAVGWFVTMFAVVEKTAYGTLQHFTGTSPKIAACIFSGTRIDAAMSYLKRIAEATDWPDGKVKLLDHIKLQLGEITQLRNDLLHYGITGDTADTLFVTNEHLAHIKSRIRATRISAKILADASADLVAVMFFLSEIADKIDWPSMESSHLREAAKLGVIPGAFAKTPWQYKPERQDHQAQKPPVLPQARKRLPPPSRA